MENEDGDSKYHLPLGGIIGITVGGTFLVMCLIIYLICKTRINRRQSDITLGTKFRHGRPSLKGNTFNLSWRKSDEDENLRPASGDSNTSYQFDANAMRSRENTGRISYDAPYSVLQKLESDQAEVQKRRLENGLSTQNVSSGFGPVSMISPGYTYDFYDANATEVTRASFPPPPPEDEGFMSQGQGQSGRLPEYSTPHEFRQTQIRLQPDYQHDSFRSSMGVDLGANIEKGLYTGDFACGGGD